MGRDLVDHRGFLLIHYLYAMTENKTTVRDNLLGGFNYSWKGTATEIRNTAVRRQHGGVSRSHHWICSGG